MKISKKVIITSKEVLEFLKQEYGYEGNLRQAIFSAIESDENKFFLLEGKMMRAAVKYRLLLDKKDKSPEEEKETDKACAEWMDLKEDYVVKIFKAFIKLDDSE